MINALLYNNTIFHALDQPRLEREKKENKDISLMGRVQLGIQQGALGFLQTAIADTVIFFFATQLFDNTVRATIHQSNMQLSSSFWVPVVIGPVIEEIAFRGILQNDIWVIQKATHWLAPSSLKKNRMFVWITSSNCRILIVGGLFAAVHLTNAPY